MTVQITILGCGTSGGVPRASGDWGACDPSEPRNRRTRCSILVEKASTRVLVDTSPDMRNQLLAADVKRLDAVVWTHDHADQCHGIDDIRAFFILGGKPLPAYACPRTTKGLMGKFGYCFERPAGSMYPPIMKLNTFTGPFRIGDLDIEPIEQDHGNGVVSQGFRFGDVAYSNDVVNLSEAAFRRLEGLKLWIVDAMRYTPHPSHAHLGRTLEWVARIRPERTVLTNMHIDLDYRKLLMELPKNVEPGYDGMVLRA